jgi:tetratricopeptide (TPR) repeat protein
MYSGESAVIFANSKYVYGPLERVHGDYVLPPNSDVVYNVRIKSLIKDENVLRDPEFQLKIALSKKQIGNDCYQYEWSDGHGKSNALLHYKKGADLMMNMLSEVDDDTDLKDRVLQVLVDCLNNVSAVYLRAKEYGKAKEAATQVIVRDPNNFKALIRAARAAIYDPAGSFEESEAAIAAAEEVDAEDQDLQKLKAELKRKHREYKRKSREMGKKMISGSTKGSKDHAKQIEPESSSDIAIDKERPFDSTNDKNQNLRPLSVDTTRHLWTKVLPYLIQILTPILTFYILNFLWKKPENQNS